jgi:protein-L-isoaspartate(D-aspartate) O-methyltransferase
LCEKVYTIERVKLIADRARTTLDRLGYRTIASKVYDGTYGWKEMSPFDAIMVTAGAPDVPAPLVEQLKEGGRMVIPVGERYGQKLLTVVRTAGGAVTQKSIPCVFVPLIGNHGWKE